MKKAIPVLLILLGFLPILAQQRYSDNPLPPSGRNEISREKASIKSIQSSFHQETNNIILNPHVFQSPSSAKFEPPDGKVYHGVGQSWQGVNEYIEALGDSAIHPVIHKLYYDIPGPRGDRFAEMRQLLQTEKTIGRIPELSLAFTDGKNPTDSLIAESKQYDYIIDSLALLCKEFGTRMFVRPGFEFNGKWNGYQPYVFVKAFRKIVDRFKALNAVDSVAFMWCYYPAGPNDFDSTDARGARWYPGDEYVDWFGLDIFKVQDFLPSLPDYDRGQITAKGKTNRFIAMARAKNKPVFLSETSATAINISPDPQDGIDDWNTWFAPFWEFIETHREIKGFCYINWDWTKYPQWATWGDSRIQINQYILNQYRQEMCKIRYIHLPYSKTATVPIPDKVELVSPSHTEEVLSSTIPLIWQKAQPDVDRYHLQVSQDSRFITILRNDSTLTDTSSVFSGLIEGYKYFWRVRAHNAAGWGMFSDIWSFGRKDTSVVSPIASVVIDDAIQYQTMEGWGASSNFFEEQVAGLPERTRKDLFDLVYSDLGMNILCIRLYADFQKAKGAPYNWDVMASQRVILNEALSRGNIDFIWLKVSSPPGWMKDNNDNAHGGNVKPEHYQDYGDYLSFYIRRMRSAYGITINAVSIFNEPGFGDASVDYESTSTTPEEYRDILKVIGATFERDGLQNVMLIGPETGHIKSDSAYFTTLLSDPVAASYLSKITTHQYGDALMLYGTGPGDDWEWLRALAASSGKPIWETEVFVGGGGTATKDIEEGLRAALLMWTAVTKGQVAAWHYWQYAQPENPGDTKSPGIIALNRDNTFTVYPRYYCIKHWAKNVPRYAMRIDSRSDNKDLYTLAFQHADKITLIAFNRTETDISTTFASPLLKNAIAHTRTSADENYKEQAQIEPANGFFDIVVKAKSISTFVVKTGATSISDDNSAAMTLEYSLYPNPATHSSVATIRLSKRCRIRLELLDLLGRKVIELNDSEAGEGTISIPIQTRTLSAGAYYLRLITPYSSQTKILNVMK